MIEDLPVDRNSRPLDEAMVKSCGELVKQTKGKKVLNLVVTAETNLS